MPRSASLALTLVIGANALAVAVAPVAQAGTKGGLYSFDAMLVAPHPFANVPNGFDLPPGAVVQPMSPQVRATQPLASPAMTSPTPVVRPRTVAPPPPPTRQVQAQPARPQAQPRPARQTRSDRGIGGLFSGLYFTVMGGYDQPDDLGGSTGSGQSFTTDVDAGYMIGIALGRYFGHNTRGEFELSFRSADYEKTTVGSSQSTGGSLETTALMLNGYYGFQFDSPIVPYVGAGLGAAFIDGSGGTVGSESIPKRSSTELAYQGILGAAWTFTSGYAIGLEGRYFGTSDSDVNSATALILARINL